MQATSTVKAILSNDGNDDPGPGIRDGRAPGGITGLYLGA